jgi:hemoglobin-like flavoprotein
MPERARGSHSMTDAELALFNDSLTRCTSNPQFLERFYALFLASSDEVRHKFSQTDFQKQRRLLQATFYMVMLAVDGYPEGTVHLERLVDPHSQRHLDIPPHLYDVWLDCLLQAVREYDGQWTPETESLWQHMMANGTAFMKARYPARAEQHTQQGQECNDQC